MLHHQMSLKKMKRKNCRNYCRLQRQFLNFLMLSIMWTMMCTQTMARPNKEDALLSNKPTYDIEEQQQQRRRQPQRQQQQQQQDFYLDDIATNINNEKLFNKMQKYHHIQPNHLNRWPGLRDLVATSDYDDNNSGPEEQSNELFNTRLFERLRQLASPKTAYDNELRLDDDDPRLMPIKTSKSYDSLASNQLSFKDHNIKKNVQYMSPCHFKICNMGRKRDARFFGSN